MLVYSTAFIYKNHALVVETVVIDELHYPHIVFFRLLFANTGTIAGIKFMAKTLFFIRGFQLIYLFAQTVFFGNFVKRIFTIHCTGKRYYLFFAAIGLLQFQANVALCIL